MRELLIVIADFYLADGGERSIATEASKLPGLTRAIRFGTTSPIEAGWRAWLARWSGREALADLPPATVASAAASETASESSVWIAQPVHLITGMRSVHLDHAGMLRVDPATQSQLVDSFTRDFASSSFKLAPLASGSFLLTGPSAPNVKTTDPARYLGLTIEGAAPSGVGAAGLQRLAAEMEMWLHEHPVNGARARLRQRSISTLWLWGGGAPLTQGATQSTQGEVKQALLGDDPYLDGLLALGVAKRITVSPVTADLSCVFDVNADRAAVVVEAYRLPESSSISTPLQAIEEIDRRWVAPAVDALGQGRLERLHIVANDRYVTMRSKDRLKIWRRPREALTALSSERLR